MSGPSSSVGGLFASPPPPAAIDVSSRRVSVVGLAVQGGTRTITGHAIEPLPAGLLTPVMNGINIHDPAAFAAALTTVLDRVTPRPKRVALILPDTVAKVSMLRFDRVTAKPQEFEQLVRWQMRKTVPFRIEDAQLSWAEAAESPEGGREYLVVAARRDIVESYERGCDAAGVHAGIVDITSLNLVNAVLATSPAASSGDPSARSAASRASSGDDWLLVHTAPESTTLIVVRNGRVIFYRNRPSEGAAQDMGDLVHQTAMYYEDRLGGQSFGRVIVAGASEFGANADHVRRQVEDRLGVRVEPLDVRGSVSLRDRLAAGPDLLDAIAPAVGVILRDGPAAAVRPGGRVA